MDPAQLAAEAAEKITDRYVFQGRRMKKIALIIADTFAPLVAERDGLQKQLTEARQQLTSRADPQRIIDWFDSGKPATLAFTAGPERQIASLIETARQGAEGAEGGDLAQRATVQDFDGHHVVCVNGKYTRRYLLRDGTWSEFCLSNGLYVTREAAEQALAKARAEPDPRDAEIERLKQRLKDRGERFDKALDDACAELSSLRQKCEGLEKSRDDFQRMWDSVSQRRERIEKALTTDGERGFFLSVLKGIEGFANCSDNHAGKAWAAYHLPRLQAALSPEQGSEPGGEDKGKQPPAKEPSGCSRDIPDDLAAAIEDFLDAGRKYRHFLKRNYRDRLYGVIYAEAGTEMVLYSEAERFNGQIKQAVHATPEPAASEPGEGEPVPRSMKLTGESYSSVVDMLYRTATDEDSWRLADDARRTIEEKHASQLADAQRQLAECRAALWLWREYRFACSDTPSQAKLDAMLREADDATNAALPTTYDPNAGAGWLSPEQAAELRDQLQAERLGREAAEKKLQDFGIVYDQEKVLAGKEAPCP